VRLLKASISIAIVLLILLFSAFVLALTFIPQSTSQTLTVPSNSQTNKTLILNKGDTVAGSFLVSGASVEDINFYVTDPAGNVIVDYSNTTENSFYFSVPHSGAYPLTFDNSLSSVSSKTVVLNLSIHAAVFGLPLSNILSFIAALFVVISGVLVVLVWINHLRAPKIDASAQKKSSEEISDLVDISIRAKHCKLRVFAQSNQIGLRKTDGLVGYQFLKQFGSG